MIWGVAILIVLYCLLFLSFIIGFALSSKSIVSNKEKIASISVIIPIHNEIEHLQKLIDNLNALKYPKKKFEILFVNDGSTDGSATWLEENDHQFKFTHFIINLKENIGKKSAIEKSLNLASFNKIATLDADCLAPVDWLQTINHSKGKLSIGTAIKISNKNSVLHKLQECESILLSGITIAAGKIGMPILASGANLSFDKKTFQSLNPFEDNRSILSGDDMFLLEKMLENDKKITVRPHHPVLTNVKNSWKGYLNQTTRWAAKTPKLKIKGLKFVAITTYLGNLAWLVAIIAAIYTKENIFITLAIIKVGVDILFLILTSLFYKRAVLILFAPIVAVTYPVYLIVLSVKVLTYKENWSSNG